MIQMQFAYLLLTLPLFSLLQGNRVCSISIAYKHITLSPWGTVLIYVYPHCIWYLKRLKDAFCNPACFLIMQITEINLNCWQLNKLSDKLRWQSLFHISFRLTCGRMAAGLQSANVMCRYIRMCQASELRLSASGGCSLARETVSFPVSSCRGGSNPGPLVTRPWTPLAYPTT